MTGNYAMRVMATATNSWGSFWFSPAQLSICTRLRMFLSVVAFAWFASQARQIEWYFFPGGWLHRSLAAQLSTATHGQWTTSFRLTPLWFADHAVAYQFYSVTGCVVAAVAFLGLGGRWTIAALTIWVLFLSQRLIWVTSSAEPVLVAMLGYLVFQPGSPLLGKRATDNRSAEHWTAGLTLRLMQTHWWLLIVFGLLLKLASISWWQGDAVWWLAATGRSTILTAPLLEQRELLVNALTHGIVLIEILALGLLLTRIGRPIGYALGLVACLCYALIADQVMYGLVLAASLQAYCDRDFKQAFEQRAD